MAPTLLGQLRAVLKRFSSRYVTACILVVLSNFLLVLNPLIFRYAITLYDRTQALGLPGWGSAYPWAVLLLTIASLSAWFKYHMRVMFITISRDAEADMRSALFDRLQHHSQPFFDRHRVGDLMSRLVNDIAIYREVLGPGVMYPAWFITMVSPAVIVLFIISPRLAWISLIPVLAIPPLMLVIRGIVYRYSRATQEKLGDMSTLAQETFAGIRLIKGFGRQEAMSNWFGQLAKDFYRMSLRLLAAENLFYPALRLLGKVVTILLVLAASFMILGSWGGLSTADLVSFMWVQSYILLPVMLLGWMLPMYQRGRGAYSRLYELYAQLPDLDDEGDPSLFPARPPSVEFVKLTFCYPSVDAPALSNVTWKVPAGLVVGLTGPAGSGKSTLMYLLARDYPAPAGAIFFSGCPLEDYSLAVLRQSIVSVEQEPILFSKSVAENIALGMPKATHTEIEEAAKKACLHDTIMRFPSGYQTKVGERGLTLSGGQRQRVALARAFLMKPSLLLLDDCFSALDALTADQVMRNIRALMNTTVLLITHRVSLLLQADTVAFLQRGEILESGKPDELVQNGGHFAALVELDRMEKGQS